MDLNKIREHLYKNINNNIDEIKKIRQTLHTYPEVAFKENATSEYIIKKLKHWGFNDITVIDDSL